MFGPAGHLYVYFTYGMHWCANAVCGEEGEGTAVLLRALAPIAGVGAMRTARGGIARDAALCSGPAKLCQAFGIDRRFDGADLTVAAKTAPWIGDDGTPPPAAPGSSKRIGISVAVDHEWRWFVARRSESFETRLTRLPRLAPMDLLADLDARGLIHDSTDRDALAKRLADGPIGVYVGFDPSGDSLHAGNLLGQVMLRRFQLAGHKPIVLAGGATGMIGDPSGVSEERNLLDPETLAANLEKITVQLEKLLDFSPGPHSGPSRQQLHLDVAGRAARLPPRDRASTSR